MVLTLPHVKGSYSMQEPLSHSSLSVVITPPQHPTLSRALMDIFHGFIISGHQLHQEHPSRSRGEVLVAAVDEQV